MYSQNLQNSPKPSTNVRIISLMYYCYDYIITAHLNMIHYQNYLTYFVVPNYAVLKSIKKVGICKFWQKITKSVQLFSIVKIK